MTNRSSS